MDIIDDKDKNDESLGKVGCVAAIILDKFFDVLAKEEGFNEIAPRLRKVVLEDGVFAEPSIRAALFPDVS